jgi:drug/metabolite transporter (DMT)-like permease
MLSMAIGVVIIKELLGRTPLLWATQTRLYGGIAVLALLLAFHPRRRTIVGSLRGRMAWGYTVAGSFLGGYVAMVIWLAGMKYTKVSIAAALNQTTTVFIFAFAFFMLREPLNRQRVIGMILGVAGSLLVTFG